MVYTVYTVDMVYAVDMVYTIYTVDEGDETMGKTRLRPETPFEK